MRVQGRIFEDGGFWLAEVPILDAMTQGTSKEDALDMAKDLVETLANRPGFSVTVHAGADGNIELGSDDAAGLMALIRRRRRACKRALDAHGAPQRGSELRAHPRGCSRQISDHFNPLLHRAMQVSGHSLCVRTSRNRLTCACR